MGKAGKEIADYVEQYGDEKGAIAPELPFKVAVGAPVALVGALSKHVMQSDRCRHGKRAPQPLEPISIDDL